MPQTAKGIAFALLMFLSIHTMMGSVGFNTGDYPSGRGVKGGIAAILMAMAAAGVLIWAYVCKKK
jgi:hypothetical protein